MLGKLTSTTLKIFPGNYEIVGKRPGFRDVVVPVQVRAGTQPLVHVACAVPL